MWLRACLLVGISAAAYAQGGAKAKELEEQKNIQKIRDLKGELRDLRSKSPSGMARVSDQVRIFREIAKINHGQAVRTLVGYVDEPEYAPAREDLLRILADIPGADEALVGRVMKEHIALEDPARGIAIKYLLEQAMRWRKDEFPHTIFCARMAIEDRFLALQVMGRIGSSHTVECAEMLARDKSWSPDDTGLVSCATIAKSVEDMEGPAAAQLLLTLTKDARFTQADGTRLREAMRTWKDTDLRKYVDLADLSDREKRRSFATFLGVVGFEAARAPLVRVAFNRREAPEMRAAAATALGGLRIAREDLAQRLGTLLSDPERIVRDGAADGLGRLNVIQALQAVVSMLDGPHADEAKVDLARITGLPAETDWREWFRRASSGASSKGK